MAKKIPYAIANYEEIVTGNYYFVDKTRFIRELEQYKIPVFLRPRRFGKSLWCSLLAYYYDINYADRFEELFGEMAIGRQPTSERNSYLVLRLDFSVVEVQPDLTGLNGAFTRACRDAFKVFAAENQQHADFSEAVEAGSAVDGLRAILTTIRSRNTPPLYIIIDEYDNFTNQLLTARQDDLYRELTTGESFLRTFYKVIKAGVGEGSVGRVFVTGVLPVTMDDLTSGFNIGQVITLKKQVLEMMGFTQAEVDAYVDGIFAEHDWPTELRRKVGDDLCAHYDGYRLLPDAANPLYNSTICNYYLNELVINDGIPPTETIDYNLQLDLNWLRRLAGSDAETRKLLETLLFENALPVDMAMLTSVFDSRQFLAPRFMPMSLYYLGLLTFQDDFTLVFPNLTVKTLFTRFFNEMEEIEVSQGYNAIFRQFLDDHDLAMLFAGYWQVYIGQIPAQAFDKANENFFRTTFYELCLRHLARHLMIAIEVNHPTGRSDWEAIGRPHTAFEQKALLLEFKHFPRVEGERLGVLQWTSPRPEEVTQVTDYAADLQHRYPNLRVHRHVVYTVACAGFRFFTLD